MLSSVSAYSDGTGDDIPRRERTEPTLRPPGAGAYRDAAAYQAPPPPGGEDGRPIWRCPHLSYSETTPPQ